MQDWIRDWLESKKHLEKSIPSLKIELNLNLNQSIAWG